MDERGFVSKKRADWVRLESLISKAGGRQGVRGLGREELLALGPLYRRASSDLAYARARAISPDLVAYLNGLVGRAHALMYEAETSRSPARSVFDFYLYEFPALLQRYVVYFLAAVVATGLGIAFAYWLVIHQPNKIWVFIPEGFRQAVEGWKSGKVADPASAAFSSSLMTHNLEVDLISFAAGVLGGIPTACELFINGATLGALAALMTQVHHHDTLWPGILPHGIAEFTAMFICGAAGFRVGIALLLPGAYTRRDALRLAALDAVKLVLGTIPLTIFAGIVEGMFSHLAISATVRYTFAGVNGLIWYLYLFLPRRRTDVSAALADRNSVSA
ncbi:MAG TPA: stage II sporulation protein M [Chthonomonadaceae bacterium]|nr:stage II sporulation protein M [Chthonomonadaceae bacterium]